MEKLDGLTTYLEGLFTDGMPCLWLSGGKDSRLLLEVMLKFDKPFGILRFSEGLDREQMKALDAIILEKNLQVFTYPPLTNLLIGENGELSLFSQIAVDGYGATTSIIKDIVPGTRCAFDIHFTNASNRFAPIEFDHHIWGSRADDGHWLCGDTPLTDKCWQVGTKTFHAPLYEWTAEEVAETLQTAFDVAIDERITGDIKACVACLASNADKVFCLKDNKFIPTVKWDMKGNTQKARYAVSVH